MTEAGWPHRPTVAWRLTREKHADIAGEGARLSGGRWNSPGLPVVYLSQDAALAILEGLVHLDLTPELIPDDYVLMRLDLAPLTARTRRSWLQDHLADPMPETDSRGFGDQWVEEQRTAVLRVRSVIVPESFNLLLNPSHPLSTDLPEPTHRPFAFDTRLLAR